MIERFIIPTRDQEGGLAGYTSLSRNSIVDVSYMASDHSVYITLISSYSRGKTVVDALPAISVKNGRKEHSKSLFKEYPLFAMEGFNHSVSITDEKDMYDFWNWLHHAENASDSLKRLRKDVMIKIEQAKRAAQDAADQAKAEAEATANVDNIEEKDKEQP